MAIRFEKVMLCVIVLLAVGCDKKEHTYYDDDRIKSTFYLENGKKEGEEKIFYPSGELMVITNYHNGIFIDSIVKYNIDGSYKSILIKKDDSLFLKKYQGNTLIAKGRVDKKLEPEGWWSFYKNDKIISKEETILVDGKKIINRQKKFREGIYDSLHSKTYTFIKPLNIVTNKQYPFEIKFQFRDKERNLLVRITIIY